jgi:hypothetical protein
MTEARSGRRYQLPAPDRTGALLGLSHRVVAVAGVGLGLGAVALARGAAVVSAACVVTALTLCVARWDGRSLLEAGPERLAWMRLRANRRWTAPLPLGADGVPLPPALDGQHVLRLGPAEHGLTGVEDVAVVHDRPGGTVSVSLRLSGRHFGLVDAQEQDAALARWGEALAAFARDRAAVTAVRWSEWAAPAGVAEHAAFVRDRCADPHSAPARAYQQLLASAGPLATRHEVLLTLTVAVGRRRRPGQGPLEGAVQAVCAEARLLVDRLRQAGLGISGPLSPEEVAVALRSRLDPAELVAIERRGATLGRASGLVRLANAGPLATEASWSFWRVDGCLHRSFYVADWPRVELPADWMSGLLAWTGAVRAITLVAEPVGRRESQQAVRRQATKLESDREHRERRGFRVGAQLRRTEAAVAQREEELVSGYPEFTYAGLVTVSAPDPVALDRASDDLIQVAGGLGIELRPLHGRHDQAMAVSLPLARGLASPRRAGRLG